MDDRRAGKQGTSRHLPQKAKRSQQGPTDRRGLRLDGTSFEACTGQVDDSERGMYDYKANVVERSLFPVD